MDVSDASYYIKPEINENKGSRMGHTKKKIFKKKKKKKKKKNKGIINRSKIRARKRAQVILYDIYLISYVIHVIIYKLYYTSYVIQVIS